MSLARERIGREIKKKSPKALGCGMIFKKSSKLVSFQTVEPVRHEKNNALFNILLRYGKLFDV